MAKKLQGYKKVYSGTEEPEERIPAKDERIIVEEPDVNIANDLAKSGEWCQPRYSENRNCYILIRRKKV